MHQQESNGDNNFIRWIINYFSIEKIIGYYLKAFIKFKFIIYSGLKVLLNQGKLVLLERDELLMDPFIHDNNCSILARF